MSLHNPVVWQDGMFMKPQHFQQLDRFHSQQVSLYTAFSSPLNWGISRLEINAELLKMGKIGVTVAEGILQDRTPFAFPSEALAPAMLEVDTSTVDKVVYLCCPLPSEQGELYTNAGDGARYRLQEQQVVDCLYDSEDTTTIHVGSLNFRLMLETEDRSAFTSIPILKISEVKSDGTVLLDDKFIPTCLDIKASAVLTKFVTEFASLLKHRAESIVSRLGVVDQQGVSSVADFMLLQVVNKLEPVFWHLAGLEGVHPEALYRVLLQAEGELATLCTSSRRPETFSPYNHGDLTDCMWSLISRNRNSLTVMSEQRAIPLVLKEQGYGIRVANIADREIIQTTTFILAVKADVTLDVLHTRFVSQVKVGSLENIRDLVNFQLPGIAIKAMPVVPRQLPYHAGFTYFELDKASDEWKALSSSAGIAMHVSGDFPNIELQMWAVRL
ncbi:type VI secretion system baseplate subunit TssK [Photobacterium sp. Hal280]|uniref:type VI secretion system baseplate subunit TssK n=1 Tax=Photobacterium sp. Hal280 TaxID=3035163 RepID=UPI00301D36DF